MAVQDEPRFWMLAVAFVRECRRHGVRLDRAAAAGLLTSQVTMYSRRAHVSESEVLTRYFDDGWPRRFAAVFLGHDGGSGRRAVEADRALGLDNACDLLTTLARAVELAAASGGHADRAECDLAIVSAAACLAEFGVAIRSRTSPDVILSGSAVQRAREMLEVTIDRVGTGIWRRCWCEDPMHQHDEAVSLVEQLEVDLLLLR